jgi:adenylosuccinate lyase
MTRRPAVSLFDWQIYRHMFSGGRMSKFEARQLLDQACARSVVEEASLAEVLADMPEVRAVLSEEEIAELSDPRSYTGSASEIVNNVLAAAIQME